MKKSKRLIALGLASVTIISLAGCTVSNSNKQDENGFTIGETEGRPSRDPVKKSIWQVIKDKISGEDDYLVAFYGCPNSKRVKRLNLLKRRVKV